MATVPVADGSECSYNTITFGSFTQTISARIRPQYSRDGRTVTHNTISLTIRTIVTTSDSGDATTDDAMELIRRKLTEPGGKLVYVNKGFGDLRINIGAVRDVAWGPKPMMLDWKPLGGNQSVEIVWGVEVNIPLCGNGTAQYQFHLMEFTYGVQWSIDQSGFNTRTVSGRLKIPMTRVQAGDKRISDSADRYRDMTTPLIPVGYRRVNQQFNLSDDKTDLSWTYVDTELPSYNVPPPKVVKVSASHTVFSGQEFVVNEALNWIGTLAGSYEIAKDAPRALAAKHFFELLAERTAGPRARARANASKVFILRRLVLSEPNIYDRECGQFQCTYQFTGSAEDVLNGSGLWTPTNSDYRLWAVSLNDTAFNNRGAYKTGLTDPLQSDSIVDLCLGDAHAVPRPAVLTPRLAPAAVLPVRNPAPAKNNSWLSYNADISLHVEDNVTELKPLPPKAIFPDLADGAAARDPIEGPRERTLRPIAIGDGRRDPAAILREINRRMREATLRPALALPDPQAQAYRRTVAARQKSILQYRTQPRMYVHFRGEALRAGWLVSPPTLLSYGGRKVMPANGPDHGFRQHIAASWLGLPIVRARWHFRYILTELPFKGAPIAKGPHE